MRVANKFYVKNPISDKMNQSYLDFIGSFRLMLCIPLNFQPYIIELDELNNINGTAIEDNYHPLDVSNMHIKKSLRETLNRKTKTKKINNIKFIMDPPI